MTAGFPDFVFNSPQDRSVLRRVFSYEADIYDLEAYERILPGMGQRIWDMIEAERAHQKAMPATLRRDAERYGYIIR
jgi:uncharacterized membrane protein